MSFFTNICGCFKRRIKSDGDTAENKKDEGGGGEDCWKLFIDLPIFQLATFNNIYGCCKRRLRSGGGDGAEKDDDDGGEEDFGNLFFSLSTLELATNFFSDSNLLGKGGFGPVYKGLLPNGQLVAVKKLSLESRQGVIQFTNEVKLLLKVQHKNLVILLGCCVDGPEKMLVYEYLRHKSLDCFLFDKEKSHLLNWAKRFSIVTGIARGLLYLHEESPERILHRDIKAGNILLDEQLNPKISDFGLARLFPGDDTHLHASTVAGTHGYMPPEYAMRGYLSVKTDVFSFGILVLEIVSGRQNQERKLDADKADLLNYAWKLYQEGKAVELVDKTLDTYNPFDVAMCIQLGLLCCQASVAERPDMNTIYLMLGDESFTLPVPGKPAIQGRVGRWTNTSSTAFTDDSKGTSSTQTGVTKTSSTDSSLVKEYSRNSMSISSMDEGR